MRVIVRRLVTEALNSVGDIDWTEKVFAGGAIREDNVPPRPFAVIRFGVTNPGMSHIKDMSCTVWIHDDGGDYERIDESQKAIYARMDGAEHVSEPGGSAELIQARWQSTSEDSFDPGFRTLTKFSTYRLIGTGV